MGSGSQPQTAVPGRGSTWLAAAHALGVAFLVWQVIPLEEWLMCLALGSPLRDTPQRLGALGQIRAATGLVAMLGGLVFVVVSAVAEAKGPRSGGMLSAAGPAAAVLLVVGCVAWPSVYPAAFGGSTVLCFLCAGGACGRLAGRHAWRSRRAELVGRAGGLLLGAAAGGAVVFGSLPRCLSGPYEGLFAASPVLVALTVASFSIARAVQGRRAARGERAAGP
jgi:hypothetical protein